MQFLFLTKNGSIVFFISARWKLLAKKTQRGTDFD